MIYCVIRKDNSHPHAYIYIWHSQDSFTIIAHINCVSHMNIHIKYKISHLFMSLGLYIFNLFFPPPQTKFGGGIIIATVCPSVRPSVRLSVTKILATVLRVSLPYLAKNMPILLIRKPIKFDGSNLEEKEDIIKIVI